MTIQKIMRDYHKPIICIGLLAGLVSAVDASGLYEIGLVNMNIFIQLIIFAAIVAAGYTYYSLFWETKFRPRQRTSENMPTVGPTGQQAQSLEDLGTSPPEMKME